MHRLTYPLIALAAVLAFLSLFVAGLALDYADHSARQGVLYVWFYLAPMLVDRLFLPESDAGMLLLAVSVYTLQYVGLFAFARAVHTLVHDFVRPYRHRTGLGRTNLA